MSSALERARTNPSRELLLELINSGMANNELKQIVTDYGDPLPMLALCRHHENCSAHLVSQFLIVTHSGESAEWAAIQTQTIDWAMSIVGRFAGVLEYAALCAVDEKTRGELMSRAILHSNWLVGAFEDDRAGTSRFLARRIKRQQRLTIGVNTFDVLLENFEHPQREELLAFLCLVNRKCPDIVSRYLEELPEAGEQLFDRAFPAPQTRQLKLFIDRGLGHKVDPVSVPTKLLAKFAKELDLHAYLDREIRIGLNGARGPRLVKIAKAIGYTRA